MASKDTSGESEVGPDVSMAPAPGDEDVRPGDGWPFSTRPESSKLLDLPVEGSKRTTRFGSEIQTMPVESTRTWVSYCVWPNGPKPTGIDHSSIPPDAGS